MSLTQYEEDFKIFVEAGFIAVSELDEDSAIKLFRAALTLDPTHTMPKIGLASIAIHKLEIKRAVSILEEVMQQEPKNMRAAALLGISYILSNQRVEEGEKLLNQAVEQGDDEPTRELGALWLEVLQKAVRKSDSPAQPKQPTEKEAEAKKK